MTCDDCKYVSHDKDRWPCDSCCRNPGAVLRDHHRPVIDTVGWEVPDTIPVTRPVLVKTVTGIVCKAKVRGGVRWIKRAERGRPRSVACVRLDGATSGDVRAVGWREL